LLSFTFIGCGGISVNFNSDDKATQGEVKQNRNAEDKSKVTVNITNETPKTHNKTDVVVIRGPIPVDINNGSFVFLNSYCSYLTQNQVSSLTDYQLGIARNEIYTRHGYIFSLEQFRCYIFTC